jgi:hypothetical protein
MTLYEPIGRAGNRKEPSGKRGAGLLQTDILVLNADLGIAERASGSVRYSSAERSICVLRKSRLTAASNAKQAPSAGTIVASGTCSLLRPGFRFLQFPAYRAVPGDTISNPGQRIEVILERRFMFTFSGWRLRRRWTPHRGGEASILNADDLLLIRVERQTPIGRATVHVLAI